MALCNVECMERVAQYLNVSPSILETLDTNISLAPECKNKSSPVQSFNTIIYALARHSDCPGILGSEKETQALTQQWLEYITVCINYARLPANTKRVLNDLNTVLKDNTYITGTRKTIADVTLYYVLYPIMKELTQQEKAQYVHVSRWFDNVQQEEKLRQELDLLSFNMLHLFL